MRTKQPAQTTLPDPDPLMTAPTRVGDPAWLQLKAQPKPSSQMHAERISP